MDLVADERPSDSPFVERVWRSHSQEGGSFICIAESYWMMVVGKYQGKTSITVRGPTTRATPAYSPADVEFFGIQFKQGTFMPNLSPKFVMDRRDVNLPDASSRSFWLNGAAWQFPDFDNADTFVERLVREGLLIHDTLVDATLQGQPSDLSLRTVQRRFLQATGLTQGGLYQIERARQATILLKQGVPILDVVEQTGYFDQPHLTKALRHFVGQTPAQIISPNRSERLSFLYKTEPLALAYDPYVRTT